MITALLLLAPALCTALPISTLPSAVALASSVRAGAQELNTTERTQRATGRHVSKPARANSPTLGTAHQPRARPGQLSSSERARGHQITKRPFQLQLHLGNTTNQHQARMNSFPSCAMSLLFIKKPTWIPNPKRQQREFVPMEEVPGPEPHPPTPTFLASSPTPTPGRCAQP